MRNMSEQRSTHDVVSVAFQDAGDTTRAIAMADALRRQCPPDHDLKITFLSCGSRFEYRITEAGFPLAPAPPRLQGIPTVNYLPVPLHPASFANGLIRDLPHMLPLLTRLPRPWRQYLAGWCSGLMIKAPIFRQRRLGAAAAACGWPISGPITLLGMGS